MIPRYSMLIQWSEEDQVYVVTLPEFHGPQTHGDTYEKAAKAGREVLELLIETYQEEGRTLPPASIYDTSAPAVPSTPRRARRRTHA